jgi:type II secretory pathway component GspD/PulD (secretin)
MEFRDTDLPTVLRAICRGAHLDFVLDPAVKGEVTAKLQNTSWESALDIILKSHGLQAKRQGGTLLIAPVPPAEAEARAEQERVVATLRADGHLDLDASGADIREAVSRLAGATEMNILVSKDVAGSVTASLHGLLPEEILLALADSIGATVVDKDNVIRLVPRAVEPAANANPGPAATSPGLEPTVVVTSLNDGRLAIHAREASVREVLARLAAASGVHIVAAPRIAGTITLDLEGIQAQDVLTAIAEHSQIVFRPVGNILFAEPVPPAVQTATFRLRYASAEAMEKALTQSIEAIKVATEKANNVLIVAGPPDAIAAARAIVAEVETPPVQVNIETRIVETNLTGDERLGVEWSDSIGLNLTTPTIPHTWPIRRGRILNSGDYLAGYDPSDARTRPGMATPEARTSDFKFGFLSSTGLSAVLHLLNLKTNTRMVANPMVTAVENQQAEINIVTKFPIATYEVSSDTGRLVISGFEYEKFGTILRVTPRVSDGLILLDVHPEVSRQAGRTQFEGAELPIIHSQETHTQVRIKDGETLVIAGLIREDTEDREKRVPWFSRIPLVGLLFRSTRSQIDQRRNLLIFITPHIVTDKDFADSAELRRRRTEPLPAFDRAPGRRRN